MFESKKLCKEVVYVFILAAVISLSGLLLSACEDTIDKQAPLGNGPIPALMAENPTSTSGVMPEYAEGNPDCFDLGFDDGVKFDGAPGPSGEMLYIDGVHVATVSSDDATHLSFIGTDGLIQAVIVKGGPHANIYLYAGDTTEDSGLISPPVGVDTDNTPMISHVDVCINYQVSADVTMTIQPHTTFDWVIDKSVELCNTMDPPAPMEDYDLALMLSHSQVAKLCYTVDVVKELIATKYDIAGTVTVTNPWTAYMPMVDSVDFTLDDMPVMLTCVPTVPTDAPLIKGDNIVCTYEEMEIMALPTEGMTTIAVVNDNPVEQVFDLADAEMIPPITHNNCVEVMDILMGALNDGAPLCDSDSFFYEMEEPAGACSTTRYIENTANITSSDPCFPHFYREDSTLVRIETAPCSEGCTLTQGYWKTHSEYGPAAHPNDTWYTEDVGGPDTLFYNSGLSHLKIMWTPPKRGNIYVKLAHQYIAAVLNAANGADVPTGVQEAIDAAAIAFEEAPASAYDGKIKGTMVKDLNRLHATLSMYNEGEIGPGHCDDFCVTIRR